jgi:hypothetical protein
MVDKFDSQLLHFIFLIKFIVILFLLKILLSFKFAYFLLNIFKLSIFIENIIYIYNKK